MNALILNATLKKSPVESSMDSDPEYADTDHGKERSKATAESRAHNLLHTALRPRKPHSPGAIN